MRQCLLSHQAKPTLKCPFDKGSAGKQYTKTRGVGRWFGVAQVKAFIPTSSDPDQGFPPLPQDTPRNCERYLNWAHAFLVVYSLDSRQSFEGSSSYLELLALHAKETQRSYPTLLLGNKLDMAQYR